MLRGSSGTVLNVRAVYQDGRKAADTALASIGPRLISFSLCVPLRVLHARYTWSRSVTSVLAFQRAIVSRIPQAGSQRRP